MVVSKPYIVEAAAALWVRPTLTVVQQDVLGATGMAWQWAPFLF